MFVPEKQLNLWEKIASYFVFTCSNFIPSLSFVAAREANNLATMTAVKTSADCHWRTGGFGVVPGEL
jgi:hypothetical protein